MNRYDLLELDLLLMDAHRVVSMHEVHLGERAPEVIGLRHDVDDNVDSLNTAVRMAKWEAARGYRSTYFMLHTASYWTRDGFPAALDQIAGFGHEIGIHANAITIALTHGGDPAEHLAEAITYLRDLGYPVHGVAPHGDQLCYVAGFVNDEMFTECARPEMGDSDRKLEHNGHIVKLDPMPLTSFGLAYETYRLPRGRYLSDSGGTWNITLNEAASGPGQLHILQHPDWWANAFEGSTKWQ